ncbi:hypothetical protein F7R02_24990 [Xanthomonas cissicola]|nr:hypothetical protein F7R02_24990 [Xanthomonas cissicola]
MDEAKAVAAGYGERAPVNQEIPTESARNGEIPKIQTPLFGTTRHPALSGLVIQTFPSRRRQGGCARPWVGLHTGRGRVHLEAALRLRSGAMEVRLQRFWRTDRPL